MPASAGNLLSQGMDAHEALLCSRLSLRGAKRLLLKGLRKRGLSALYDSVLFGMRYYLASRLECAEIDHGDATQVFHELARRGVFEDGQAFKRLSLSVERILWQGADRFDSNAIVLEVEAMLTKFGVLIPHKGTRSRN